MLPVVGKGIMAQFSDFKKGIHREVFGKIGGAQKSLCKPYTAQNIAWPEKNMRVTDSMFIKIKTKKRKERSQ